MIKKIIIPAAGIGSRFLPITKSIPKEMLPLSNKPAIEYIVQEALDAHITDMLIVLSPEKTVIIDYFSRNHHLEQILAQAEKSHYLDNLNTIIQTAHFHYFIQNKPMGVANALLHAQPAIDRDEFFAVALPDDILFGKTPEIKHLIDLCLEKKAMVIGVQQVPLEQISSYGVVAPAHPITDNHFLINHLVEKPSKENAPSQFAIVGRYIFHSSLFTHIPQTPLSTAGEILLPDTINLMIKKGFPVYAHIIQSQRFDTGTPAGWIDFIKNHNNF